MPQVDFDMSEADVVAFKTTLAAASPLFQRSQAINVWALRVAGLFFCGVLWDGLRRHAGPAPSFAAFALGAVAVFVGAPRWWRLRVKWRIQKAVRSGKNVPQLGRQKIALAEEGVLETQPEGQTMMRWAAIERLVASPQWLALYCSSDRAFSAPRKAFKTPEEEEEFRRYAAERSGHKWEEIGPRK